MGRGQNTNINESMEEVDSNPHGWLWGVQDFSGGSNCRWGGNDKRTKIISEAWRYSWIATISWPKFHRWGVAYYGWTKKVASWDEIYFWWISCEDWKCQ